MRRPLRTRPTPIAAALLGFALLGATAAAEAQSIDTLAIRAHAMVLAHDSLEGRGTGTPGEHRAATYIISQLERLGLEGAAPDGAYYQPLPLRRIVIDSSTRLAVRPAGESDGTGHAGAAAAASNSPGATDDFLAGTDFIFAPGRADAFRDFAGDAILAGTVGVAEQALAGAGTLEGRVIVVLGTLGNSALTLIPDWARRGASGVLLLVPQADRFRALAQAYGPDRLALAAEVDDPVWQPELPVLIAGPEVARALLADTRLDAAALDGKRPFHALPLARHLSATVRAQEIALTSGNIAALIPGSDPARRDEVVVYTAHYDHLGIGTPDERGDSIYNGFSDNAAGTAMLLAIAETLREHPPARSVLFLFFTGEERGLLGSTYYVSDPLVPLERVAAVINLDAGAPAAPPRTWRIAGGRLADGTDSALGARAARVAARNGWKTTLSEASPNSDHWPFLRAGLPAIFIIPGQDWEGVTRAEKEALQHRFENYHRPADEWHPDFPLQGLRRYAELALQIGVDAGGETRRVQETRGR